MAAGILIQALSLNEQRCFGIWSALIAKFEEKKKKKARKTILVSSHDLRLTFK